MALRIWLPLNGSLENKGISDLKVANIQSNVAIDNNGKIGKCYTNSGTTVSTVTPISISSNTFSMSAWVKLNTRRNNWCRAFGVAGDGTYAGLACEHTDGSKIGFHFYKTIDGTNTSIFDIYPTTQVVGEWAHWAMCYDGIKYYIYKNGILLTSNNANRSNINFDMNKLYLFGGASGASSQCSLNDVRIYDHCLSPLEVKEISQGLVLHYKLNGFNGGIGENLVSNSKTFLGWSIGSGWVKGEEDGYVTYNYSRTGATANTWVRIIPSLRIDPNDYPNGITVSMDIKPVDISAINHTCLISLQTYNSAGTRIGWREPQRGTGGMINNTWTRISHTFSQNDLKTISVSGYTAADVSYTQFSFQLVQNGDITIRKIKIENGDKATSWTPALSDFGIDITKITDSSGYEYNLNIVGNPSTSTDTERYSQSMYVSNGTYFINPVSCKEYMPTDSLTVNIWIKPTTWNNPISCTQGGGWNFESSPIRFPVYVSGVGYKTATSTTTGASLVGDWHMLTGTFDRENVKIYIDGELQATTATGSTNGISYANNGLVIGGEASSSTTAADSSAYTGNISDVRIYATALSAEDILNLYHTPVNIDNLQNIHSFEFQENGIKTSIYQNGVMSTIDEIHESNAELLNNFTSGTFTPLKNTSNSTINFGIVDFSNYTGLNQDLKIHIELDAEWTAFTPDTGGTFQGIWFQGANYKIGATNATWAGTNYPTSSLNSAHSLRTATAITSAGKYHFDTIATIPASWFATYDRSNFGMRCDYSDGTGVFKISNVKITLLQYYNAKIGENFISANIFIEK